jgi:large subunit ribosomal protein L3
MIGGLLARKVGMTQVFTEDGRVVPVTVLQAGPCTVLQIRTREEDGYQALQLGFDDKRRQRATKPERGHAQKASAEPKKFVREVRWDGQDAPHLGQNLTVELFSGVKYVDVTGTTKGHGFTGVVRRHKFSGGPKTHGQSDRQRAPGSIGASSNPSRVFKGMRMAGRMGGVHTVRNLKVHSIDPQTNTIAVVGAIAGHAGGYVIVRRAVVPRRAARSK